MSMYHGWYPQSQICYPPELPVYLKNVYDLKPIVGAPRDDEVIGIHAVMNAAHRVLGVPGMDDPGSFMKLADHLFSAQMARYRSKYSLITFPSDATYTPPTLPSHVPIHLKPVSGAPSDEDLTKVQDTLQAYQEFTRIPSMFDARVNMELSQHLFDIQMARYIRVAGENQPSLASPAVATAEIPAQSTGQVLDTIDATSASTNNAGSGSNSVRVDQTPHLTSGTPGISASGLVERSNQLAEQSNVLVEVLERLTQLVEQSRRPTDQPGQLAMRFNQLFDRFDQLIERFTQPARRANEIAERSNHIAEQASQLTE
ncbi:unnamed protein product [Rhizoctonia solani]|uniref:Laminin domain protein n=1 Tax=Rhizoctonia solani TaxID=456999 RepID=A0A8H3H2H9_9AGAM|nr:unnamed protein product [Rhizoctonia solani]